MTNREQATPEVDSTPDDKLPQRSISTTAMIYALLIAVGDYKDIGAIDIPTYKRDLDLMCQALNEGLRIPDENIRRIAGNEDCGKVSMKSLAHAIADIEGQLSEEDVFLLYFSGHGQREAVPSIPAAKTTSGIVFSDGMVMLQSVIDYVSRLAAGGKIVILDCCYAGDFEGKGPRKLQFDQELSDFAGKGIAVLASTSADETARLWPERKCSVFTGALSQAIIELTAPAAVPSAVPSAALTTAPTSIPAAAAQTPSPLTAGILRSPGKVSLNDIYDVMMGIITIRNYFDPAKQQYPVLRSSIGGTIYFRISDEAQKPAKTQHPHTGIIHHLKSLDTRTQKRAAVFAVLAPTDERLEASTGITTAELASAARDIVDRIRAEGRDEDVVWCYFGADERDILNSLHYAYTIWAGTEEARRKYYSRNAAAEVCDGIYVFRNNSYNLLKQLQSPTKTRDEFVRDVKTLLALIVSNAESFVYDLQEVKNRTRTMAEMRALYGPWIRRVKSLYIKLSDEDIAPNDLHDWSEAIYDLAGWVADLAILFEGERGGEAGSAATEQSGKCSGADHSAGRAEVEQAGERAATEHPEKRFLIDHTIRQYHEAIEKVRQAEPES